MAERRMFAKTIIDSDAFLDLPASAQALYFHFGMRADDDGFLNNPKKVVRMVGASEDDLKLLILKRFVLTFPNGVLVVKHWRMNNTIRKDRYTPTIYQDELASLTIKENGSYTEAGIPLDNHLATTWQPDGNQAATQYRLGKVSLGKDSIDTIGDSTEPPPPKKKAVFKKPTLAEVTEYCTQRKNYIDPQRFVDYYDTNGWMVGRNHMKDWKAAVRNWERNNYSNDRKAPRRDTSELDEVF